MTLASVDIQATASSTIAKVKAMCDVMLVSLTRSLPDVVGLHTACVRPYLQQSRIHIYTAHTLYIC